MNPGQLDKLIQIFSKTRTVDANGASIESLVLVKETYANKADQGGKLFRSYGVLRSETTSVFKFRFFDGLTFDHVIVCDGAKYVMTSDPSEVDGRRNYLLCQTRRLR